MLSPHSLPPAHPSAYPRSSACCGRPSPVRQPRVTNYFFSNTGLQICYLTILEKKKQNRRTLYNTVKGFLWSTLTSFEELTN